MELKIDDIVTVISEEVMFLDQQGQIVEIEEDGDEDGPIGVRFTKSSKFLFGIDWRTDNMVRFEENELRKDPDWSLENQAVQKFGTRMWHSLYAAPWPFSEKNLCMSEEHTESVPYATKRIVINFVGSVYQIDVCKEHEHFDGKCGESWPFVERPIPEQVTVPT